MTWRNPEKHSLLERMAFVALACFAAEITEPGFVLASIDIASFRPAAGVTAALFIRYGITIWPAMLLSAIGGQAFLMNLDPLAARGSFGEIVLSEAAAIGGAWLVSWLARRVFKGPPTFEHEPDILRFAVPVALLGVLPRPLLDTAILLVEGALPLAATLSAFAVTYAGEFAGVLVIAPLALFWTEPAPEGRFRRRPLVALPLLGVVFLLAWLFQSSALVQAASHSWRGLVFSLLLPLFAAVLSLLLLLLTARASRVTRLVEGLRSQATLRRRAQKELAAVQSQLVRAERLAAIGKVGGWVAHELNTPLGTIVNYSRTLLRKLPPGSGEAGDVENIYRAAIRAGLIIESLGAFAGRPSSTPSDLEIHALLEEVLMVAEGRLRKQNVRVERDYDIPHGSFRGDSVEIQQVFMNVVANALDAMPRGGRLKLSSRYLRFPGGAGRVEITVADSGAGVTERIRERLFNPFFTTKPPGEGTGLGLFISREILDKYRGTIEFLEAAGDDKAAGSPPPEGGGGARVRISLPLLNDGP